LPGSASCLPIGGIIDRVVLGYDSKPTGESSARVARAVDGDTLVALQDSVEERGRVLGIDTPEVFRSGGCRRCRCPTAAWHSGGKTEA
jgi:endonuclease YncB( thermonuclease family)